MRYSSVQQVSGKGKRLSFAESMSQSSTFVNLIEQGSGIEFDVLPCDFEPILVQDDDVCRGRYLLPGSILEVYPVILSILEMAKVGDVDVSESVRIAQSKLRPFARVDV
jgi:hypothetical protein